MSLLCIFLNTADTPVDRCARRDDDMTYVPKVTLILQSCEAGTKPPEDLGPYMTALVDAFAPAPPLNVTLLTSSTHDTKSWSGIPRPVRRSYWPYCRFWRLLSHGSLREERV